MIKHPNANAWVPEVISSDMKEMISVHRHNTSTSLSATERYMCDTRCHAFTTWVNNVICDDEYFGNDEVRSNIMEQCMSISSAKYEPQLKYMRVSLVAVLGSPGIVKASACMMDIRRMKQIWRCIDSYMVAVSSRSLRCNVEQLVGKRSYDVYSNVHSTEILNNQYRNAKSDIRLLHERDRRAAQMCYKVNVSQHMITRISNKPTVRPTEWEV